MARSGKILLEQTLSGKIQPENTLAERFRESWVKRKFKKAAAGLALTSQLLGLIGCGAWPDESSAELNIQCSPAYGLKVSYNSETEEFALLNKCGEKAYAVGVILREPMTNCYDRDGITVMEALSQAKINIDKAIALGSNIIGYAVGYNNDGTKWFLTEEEAKDLSKVKAYRDKVWLMNKIIEYAKAKNLGVVIIPDTPSLTGYNADGIPTEETYVELKTLVTELGHNTNIVAWVITPGSEINAIINDVFKLEELIHREEKAVWAIREAEEEAGLKARPIIVMGPDDKSRGAGIFLYRPIRSHWDPMMLDTQIIIGLRPNDRQKRWNGEEYIYPIRQHMASGGYYATAIMGLAPIGDLTNNGFVEAIELNGGPGKRANPNRVADILLLPDASGSPTCSVPIFSDETAQINLTDWGKLVEWALLGVGPAPIEEAPPEETEPPENPLLPEEISVKAQPQPVSKYVQNYYKTIQARP